MEYSSSGGTGKGASGCFAMGNSEVGMEIVVARATTSTTPGHYSIPTSIQESKKEQAACAGTTKA